MICPMRSAYGKSMKSSKSPSVYARYMAKESSQRILDKTQKPDEVTMSNWIGPENYERWKQIHQFIEINYPGIFLPGDWLFGGKHGWVLRFKKSKSFCTLIPERNRLLIQIVLGRMEREKVEAIWDELSPGVCNEYTSATTYHDGKWLAIEVDSDEAMADIKRLLAIKRKPKRT